MHRFATGLVLAGAFAAVGCGSTSVAPAAALATDQRGVTSIAVDDFFVYWAIADGSVKKVSLDGGPVTTLVAAHTFLGPEHVQVDATHVYWSTEHEISAVPKSGGAVQSLATNESFLRDFAVYAPGETSPGGVYWTTGDAVKRASVTTSATTLVSKLAGAGPITARAEGVFWADVPAKGSTDIETIPVAGGAPVQLVTGLSEVTMLFTSPTHVVWGSTGDKSITRAAIDGTDAHVVVDNLGAIGALATDDSDVYWTTIDGAVMKVAATGGVQPVVIATGRPGVVSLTLDASSLYWANPNDGAIMAMPKDAGAGSAPNQSDSGLP
jgi:hypothetical protein